MTNYETYEGDAIGGNADRTTYVAATPLTLTAPNLAVSNVTVTPQSAEAGNGSTVSLSWTVTNTSTVATNQNWTDTVYLSPTSSFNVNTAIELTSAPNKNALSGGAAYTTTLNSVVIPDLTPRSYYVFVAINSNYSVYHETYNAQPESDFGNPVDDILAASNPLVVSTPNVNLQVSNPSAASTSLVDGQSANVSFQVNNVGTETAQTSWYDAVYLSGSSTFNASSATYLDAYLPSKSPLSAGGSYSQATSVTIPDTLAPGTYFLFFVANYENGSTYDTYQQESNYNDNASTPIQITVNAPQLSIAINTAPATAKLNDSPAVSWTVTNISTQYAAYASWYDEVYLSSTTTYNSSANDPEVG